MAAASCVFGFEYPFTRPIGGQLRIQAPVHTPGTCISRPTLISDTCWNQATGALFFLSAAQRLLIAGHNPGLEILLQNL
ncbi:MAG: hypothetical protein PVG42_16705 [Lysobacterales bacterium]|jgi:hypothetical protein